MMGTRVPARVWDHLGIDLATTLEDTEDRNLAGDAPTTFSLPFTAKVVLIGFDLGGQERRFRPVARR